MVPKCPKRIKNEQKITSFWRFGHGKCQFFAKSKWKRDLRSQIDETNGLVEVPLGNLLICFMMTFIVAFINFFDISS